MREVCEDLDYEHCQPLSIGGHDIPLAFKFLLTTLPIEILIVCSNTLQFK